MKFFHTFIMALSLFALTGCGGSKSPALPATQNPPAFSAATVNDFVKNLSQAANDFAAAVKTKNNTKTAGAYSKFNDIFSKSQSALTNALKPDERQKLQEWINTLAQQMKDAAVTAMATLATPAAK